jgi:hypothetical protein
MHEQVAEPFLVAQGRRSLIPGRCSRSTLIATWTYDSPGARRRRPVRRPLLGPQGAWPVRLPGRAHLLFVRLSYLTNSVSTLPNIPYRGFIADSLGANRRGDARPVWPGCQILGSGTGQHHAHVSTTTCDVGRVSMMRRSPTCAAVLTRTRRGWLPSRGSVRDCGVTERWSSRDPTFAVRRSMLLSVCHRAVRQRACHRARAG